jgi:hypothetical protein
MPLYLEIQIEPGGVVMKKYDIRNITLEQLRQLIAEGDDKHDNQIRVTKDGMVYLSQDIVAAEQLEDIAFRFETFDAGNDYVGKAASEDDNLVIPIFNALKGNWEKGCRKTYIDDFLLCDYGNYCE